MNNGERRGGNRIKICEIREEFISLIIIRMIQKFGLELK